MKDLWKFIAALCNLYGLVRPELVSEIYNQQNKRQITVDEVLAYAKEHECRLTEYHVKFFKGYFVNDVIVEFDELELWLSRQADKPYYVPPRKELMKYADDLYFEKTDAYWAMFKYISKNFYKGNIRETKVFCEEIHDVLEEDFNFQEVINAFMRFKLDINGESQMNEILSLVVAFYNNQRNWVNRGYAPMELMDTIEEADFRHREDTIIHPGGWINH